MKLSDFDYTLPKHLIAQEPLKIRDSAKLLVLDVTNDSIEHLKFNQLPELLKKDDTLVLNNTRVVNARIFGQKPTGGKIELLILDPYIDNNSKQGSQLEFECLIKGKVKPNLKVKLTSKSNQVHDANAQVLEKIEGGKFKVKFETHLTFTELISKYGHVPLPPYIKKNLKDPEKYQTIYSNINGSVAAPTAGLHFTPELLKILKDKGIHIAYITLHISYGTFTPVRIEDISKHKMDREFIVLSKENASIINNARKSTRSRLIAVGTTTVRTLETIAQQNFKVGNQNQIKSWSGWSDLFIYPGFEFKAGIDIMITNFHLPKSTLLMLVSAFASREKIFKAYSEAIEKKYRFYSLGDAMMILK